MFALDWRKAFDAINPEAMLVALRRFGLSQHILDMISAIYIDRSFYVQDCGHQSQWRKQYSGISQGCSLSTFLFIMLMTVVMNDARATLTKEEDKGLIQKSALTELPYADDTLLMSVEEKIQTRYLAAASSIRLVSLLGEAAATEGSFF